MIEPTPEDEAALEATKAPLMEHLVELRKRLVYAMLGFLIAFGVCFAFATPIFNFLTQPLHHALKGQVNDHLIYTALTEVFFTNIKIGMFGGLCLGFPWIAAQLWMFIAPGLYRHEKRAFLPFLMWTPVLFIAGAAFVYYVMLPFAIKFFTGYQLPSTQGAMGVELMAKVSDYLDFVMKLMFAWLAPDISRIDWLSELRSALQNCSKPLLCRVRGAGETPGFAGSPLELPNLIAKCVPRDAPMPTYSVPRLNRRRLPQPAEPSLRSSPAALCLL